MEPIRLAIVGLDRFADLLFGCLEKSDRLKLCAVCETRPALLNRYRDKFPDIQFYDDPRAMVLRARPNALLLWRECCENEFLDSVMSQGCWPILRPPISGAWPRR